MNGPAMLGLTALLLSAGGWTLLRRRGLLLPPGPSAHPTTVDDLGTTREPDSR